ncbi:SAM-dependent methyltransferase [Amycolatopsis sp. cmx-8-4]|uniref:SAM-dependent methyltransferase n=1 Tax=Amycolatopsis sp. cmx-8-4 TaxID=2790947 RepID=UPI00397E157B
MTRANLPYLYDAFLYGKDAHGIELETRRHLEAVSEDIGYVFTSEQAAHLRVARYLAGYVNQLVIAGVALPGPRADDLHHVVRRANPSAAVTYVEHDPLAAAVLRAISEDRSNNVLVVETNPLDPARMWISLRKELATAPARPIGLLLGGVLSFHGGARSDVVDVVQAHVAALPAGSFLALTHLFEPESAELKAVATALEDSLRTSALGRGTVATLGEIEAMFKGTCLLPPGIVQVDAWWPEGPCAPHDAAPLVVAAVSRIQPAHSPAGVPGSSPS